MISFSQNNINFIIGKFVLGYMDLQLIVTNTICNFF